MYLPLSKFVSGEQMQLKLNKSGKISVIRFLSIVLLSMIILIIYGCCEKKPAVQYSSDILKRQHLKSFILVGDTQRTSVWEFWREKNRNVQDSVLKKISEENPAFVIHLGDLVFQGDDHCHWQDFNKFAKDIYKKNIPILPVLGNHDYYGNNQAALENYFSHFPDLNNKKYYSRRFLYLGLILLDSNFDKMNKDEIIQQNNWYQENLNKFEKDSTIKMILVAFHHPPYTNSKIVNDDLQVHNYFVKPSLNLSKVKLFFSGHCHSYEHFKNTDRHFIVSGGGGGPRHSLRTDKMKHKDSYKEQTEQKRDFNFCKITLIENGVHVKMVRMNNYFEWLAGEEFFI